MYSLIFSMKSDKQLSKMNKSICAFLISWLLKNVDNTDNPRIYGKGLLGDKSGEWRYRIGDFRAFCEIDDGKKYVLVLSIGHRKNVYKTKR